LIRSCGDENLDDRAQEIFWKGLRRTATAQEEIQSLRKINVDTSILVIRRDQRASTVRVSFAKHGAQPPLLESIEVYAVCTAREEHQVAV